jgi:hypothetical protein
VIRYVPRRILLARGISASRLGCRSEDFFVNALGTAAHESRNTRHKPENYVFPLTVR